MLQRFRFSSTGMPGNSYPAKMMRKAPNHQLQAALQACG